MSGVPQENDLLPQNGFVSHLLDSLPEGVVVVDAGGRFLVFNAAAKRIVGVGAGDIPVADWPSAFGCYLPDKVTPYPAERLPLVRAMRGEHVRDAEMFIRNSLNPSGAWVSIDSNPILGDNGKVRGGVIVFRDITARRDSLEVARRLSHAVGETADSVFMTNPAGVIEYVNPAFEKTTGYSRGEAIGKQPSILKSGQHDDHFYRTIWSTILAGNVHRGTVVNRRKDKTLFHAEQTITPVKDRNGNLTHFVSVMRDITERIRMEEQQVRLRLARDVQQRLYPTHSPDLPGFDLAGVARPADVTGGDYFDFFSMSDGRLGIAIGDASGHGFDSALLMAETRAYIRSFARTMADPERIMAEINSVLCEDTEPPHFMTMALVSLDPVRRALVHSSAGHTTGYVLDRAGKIKHVLNATGIPLGMFARRSPANARAIALDPGDTMVLLTDGITEAEGPDGEFFGPERALNVVRTMAHRRSREIVQTLCDAAMEFESPRPHRDDMTAIVCKTLEGD